MWRIFSSYDAFFMMRFLSNSETFKILLTDFKFVWCSQYNKDQLAQVFNECNPVIEIKLEEAVLEVEKLVDEIDKAVVEVECSNSEANVNIVRRKVDNCVEIIYRLVLHLQRENEEKFKEIITMPMIQTINFMEKQQNMLCDLLKRKDRELEAYRMEKGEISRNELLTEPFDQNSIIKTNSSLLLNVFHNADLVIPQLFENRPDLIERSLTLSLSSNRSRRKRRVYDKNTAADKRVVTKIIKENK